MRGPARVADAVGAVERAETNRLFEIAQFSFRATDLEFVSFIDDRDTGGVVAAIFEFSQTVDNERHNLFIAYVSNNSTHAFDNAPRLATKRHKKSHKVIFLSHFSFFFTSAGTPATNESGGRLW